MCLSWLREPWMGWRSSIPASRLSPSQRAPRRAWSELHRPTQSHDIQIHFRLRTIMTIFSQGVRPVLGIAVATAISTLGFGLSQTHAFAGDTTTVAQAQTDHGAHSGASSMPPAKPESASDTYKIGDLVVVSPWSRATPGGAKIGGGYLKVTNTGTAADRLTGATAGFADHVEIHEMSMTNGVMKMRPLDNGLEIKPGETVELKPGGFHMMFMDLKQQLKQGDALKVTLKFEKAGALDVNFSVNALGATGGSQHQH
jgi:copper(I)-binding protein